jgi:hypothetical protein
MPRTALALAALTLLITGCASIREARMAQPPSLAGVAEESFGKPGWGRQGEFMLSGERVRYERGADRLSLFGKLETGRAPLRYTWSPLAGDSIADCKARQADVGVAGVSVTARPWTLSCEWNGRPEASMQLGESASKLGKAAREGNFRRGDLTLGLRSVHLLEGSPLPQGDAVGYEMVYQGQVVGSLDLSGAVPRLRRPDPATPVGRAVTEAALALALVWDPS